MRSDAKRYHKRFDKRFHKGFHERSHKRFHKRFHCHVTHAIESRDLLGGYDEYAP